MINGEGTTLPDWLTRRAQSDPDRIAIWHPDAAWTYRELWDQATRLAGDLRSAGLQKSAYVGVLVRSGLLFAKSVHAGIQGEFRLVPFNARLTAEEIAFQIDDANLSVVLYDDALAALARQAIELSHRRPAGWNLTRGEGAASNHRCARESVSLDDDFCVIYTSGTTGKPKGAVLTYGNFFWSATGSAMQLGLSLQENWLVPMPLYHVGGLSVLMRSMIYGTTASVLDKFDESEVNHLIDSSGITLVSVVPAMLHRLLRQHDDRPYPDTLRTVLLGGSPADQSLLEQCLAMGVPVAQSYGLTEATSQVCTLPVRDSLRKIGSSGKPLLPTEISIVDEDGERRPSGVPGEIAVRGLTISPGYLNRPDAAVRPDGWLLTGDVGYVDAEGYLYVLDRRTDLIVSGGENVYPAEVESVLLAHPDVVEAGVIGMSHPNWGQVPAAFVRAAADSTVTEAQLMAFCDGKLAKYKVPHRLVFVDELPRNASGKLLRRTLRQWL